MIIKFKRFTIKKKLKKREVLRWPTTKGRSSATKGTIKRA